MLDKTFDIQILNHFGSNYVVFQIQVIPIEFLFCEYKYIMLLAKLTSKFHVVFCPIIMPNITMSVADSTLLRAVYSLTLMTPRKNSKNPVLQRVFPACLSRGECLLNLIDVECQTKATERRISCTYSFSRQFVRPSTAVLLQSPTKQIQLRVVSTVGVFVPRCFVP